MKVNVNLMPSEGHYLFVYPDNKQPIRCQVDNYPCDNPAYVKRDGFRCNDISLLDRLSFDQNVDSDLVKIISSRIKDFSTQNNLPSSMSEAQMLKTLRPSWCQTASEIREFDEMVYQSISTTDITKEQVDALNDDSVVKVDTPDNSDDDSKTS